jgi:signal transduction histidine kinase
VTPGLAIAAKAAERLGGRIVLENPNPGQTTFALVIPALDGMIPERRTPHRA